VDIAMSSLPPWAQLSIITAGVLLSPVFAFLMALVVAILLGLLMEVRVPAPFALVIAGAIGWFLFRKLWPRPPDNTSAQGEAGDRASA
jgi:predicted membrane protein